MWIFDSPRATKFIICATQGQNKFDVEEGSIKVTSSYSTLRKCNSELCRESQRVTKEEVEYKKGGYSFKTFCSLESKIPFNF